MKYRTLDENDDYSFGRQRFLTGREAVSQAIKTRMRLLYSEWWEDTQDGLPLFEKIIGSYGGDDVRQAIDLTISERILGTKGVTNIAGFESVIENRGYRAYCRVKTIYGETSLSIGDSFKHVEVVF